MYFVYILRCSDDSLYTGITRDLDRRIDEHNRDDQLGAAYTRSRRPVNLVYHEVLPTRSDASRREHQIRQMSKQEKEDLLL